MNIDPLVLIRTIAACYLIGAFPTAYVIGKLNGINIFEVGSGNMGTANAERALGWRWAGVVLVIDLLKGIVAVAVATLVMPAGWAQVMGALAAIVGHNWSIYAALLTGRLRGGKGVATWLGTFLVMAPAPAIALVLLAFGAIILLTRYVSLATLSGVAIGCLSIAVLALFKVDAEIFWQTPELYILYGVLAAAIIFYRHRSNIQRLISGTERRIGESA